MPRTSLTAKVGSIRQAGDDSLVLRDDVDDSFLDEVHLVADRSVSDDDVTGQENLELEFGDDVRDEVVIGMCEERHGGNQRATIEIDDLLQHSFRNKCTYNCPSKTLKIDISADKMKNMRQTTTSERRLCRLMYFVSYFTQKLLY